jgi:hypothetical protein
MVFCHFLHKLNSRNLAILFVLLFPFLVQAEVDLFSKNSFENLTPKQSNAIQSLMFQDQSFLDGPNCFNLSLKFSEVVNTLRFVDGQEFLFWVKSPLCRELNLTEPIQSGDIRAVFQHPGDTEEFFPVHAEVFLNSEIIFEKMGMSKDHPYAIRATPLAGRSKINGSKYDDAVRTSSCSRSYGPTNECWSWVNVYRCQSIKDYLINKDSSLNIKNYLEIDHAVSMAESLLEGVTMRRSKESATDLARVKNELIEITKKLSITIDELPVLSNKTIHIISQKLDLKLNGGHLQRLLIMNIAYRLRGIDFQLVNIKYPQADGRLPSPLIL